jgi:hypothetical protein
VPTLPPRIAAPLIAALIALTTLHASAGTPESTPTPLADPAAAALSAVVQRNASLHDYTFDVDAHIALLTFPWIRFSLSGHGQYTKDGAYTVHFDHVPWFGHGFETISMASLDPKNWPEQYTITLAKPQNDNTVLSLHDRKHTSLDETLVTIDHDQTVREILWNYANGGHVRLSIVPAQISGYALPQSEEAEIVVHGYRAMADASFTNYKVNLFPSAAPSPTTAATASGQPHRRAHEPVVHPGRQ